MSVRGCHMRAAGKMSKATGEMHRAAASRLFLKSGPAMHAIFTHISIAIVRTAMPGAVKGTFRKNSEE